MFRITKLAVSMTKLERNTVNRLSKIDPQACDVLIDSFKTAASGRTDIKKEILPYSKNIFKRAINWVKAFITNYKLFNEGFKAKISSIKENYGELFTKKRQKYVKNRLAKYFKNQKTEIKEEINSLIKEVKEEVAKK